MSALTLRTATPADIDAVMQLEADGFHHAVCEDRGVMLQRLQHFPNGFLLLEHEGRPRGYLCSELWSADDALAPHRFALGHDIRNTHDASGTRLYISSMTIDPALRGQGIGHRFFRQALDLLQAQLPQLVDSVLLLSAEWTGAHRIYVDCGYSESARLRDFFFGAASRNADAIIMQRRFTQ